MQRCSQCVYSPDQVPSSDYERQLTPGLVAQTPTPALFVFMDAVRHNVATMLRHCGGDPARWRPHLKTTKMAPVYEALLDAGVRKFKCATLKEATVLLELVTEKGTDGVDLLVAYPHVEPTLSLLSCLASKHSAAQLSVLIEDVEGAAAVCDNLGIFVDVNVGTQCRADAVAHQARMLRYISLPSQSLGLWNRYGSDRTAQPTGGCRSSEGSWSAAPWTALLRRTFDRA